MGTTSRTSISFARLPERDFNYDDNDDERNMSRENNRPELVSRPSDGRAAEPLLKDDAQSGEPGERGRSNYEVEEQSRRRHQMRSQSPKSAASKHATRKKYIMAGVFLLLSLFTFVVQTEIAVYIQSELDWRKPYFMLYCTHGSWVVLWPVQMLILMLCNPHQSRRVFLISQVEHLKTTCRMIMAQSTHLSPAQAKVDPTPYAVRKILTITCVLTIAGSTWYVAVNMTTPSDLTAIYNCSAFFAYVFSVIMLKERLRRFKIFSVVIACIGVLIVAYGDQEDPEAGLGVETSGRTLGNIIIGVGSVMYGFYEVLYKKIACPPEGVSAIRSVTCANAVGSGLGFTTLVVLWIPIPILHYLDLEPFALPRGQAASLFAVSVISNAIFSGSFLALISLTSPVLSSVAALLTIFLVAIVDWMITGKPLSPAAIIGGLVISGAFFLLAGDTWKEMKESEKKRGRVEAGEAVVSDEDDDYSPV